MAIPKQVQKQADESEALAQEHLNQQPAAAPAAQPAKPADPAPAEPAEPGNWEKRFKGLKKTHDITVSKLRKELSEAMAEIETLKKSPAPAASGSEVSSTDIMDALTDQEKQEYSPEFIDMVARLASRVSGPKVTTEIESRVAKLETTQTMSAEDKFWKKINDAVPNWRKLQATEDMQAWLLEYDDLLGMTRSEAIAQSQSTLDSSRVIAIFNQYSAPAPTTVLDEAEADLIQPEAGSGDGGAPLSADQEIWTVSQVQDFYKRLALGKFKGKDGRERAKQIEKSIEKAREDNRIVQG